MIVTIQTDESLDSEKSTVTINGRQYKDIDSLKLQLAKNAKGELIIQHTSGYLEAYQAEVKNDL